MHVGIKLCAWLYFHGFIREDKLTKAFTLSQVLRDLFGSQRSAVLATAESGRPYLSLMAFAASDDLKYLVVVTPKASRKYRNLVTDPRVALLVDNRTNNPEDVKQAIAVTVMGVAEECSPAEAEYFLGLYRDRHPHLVEFANSLENVLIKVRVDRYYLVSRFQDVREYSPGP
jgi:heme iron utilization protein